VLAAVLYTVMELPYDIAFELPPFPWLVFDGVVVLIFSVDIAVHFRLPYKNDEDEWVTDPEKIRRHYIKG
jgi:hypothetical protein